MKRVGPTWDYRLRKGIRPARKSFFSALALSGTIVGLFRATGGTIESEFLYWIGGGCVLIAIGVLIVKSRSKHLPDIVTDDKNNDESYEVSLCDGATLQEANALTKPYYHEEYVSDEVAERWREKNPKGFVSIHNKEQTLCAAFGVLAMEKSFCAQFIKGRVLDNQLEPDDILDFERSKKSSKLYISGVVVRDPDSTQGNRRACVMVWVMLNYLRRMYGTRRQRTVYALAVSKPSENLLRRFGFSAICPKNRRRDKRNLYSLNLDSRVMKQLERRIGDWSEAVRLISFDPPKDPNL